MSLVYIGWVALGAKPDLTNIAHCKEKVPTMTSMSPRRGSEPPERWTRVVKLLYQMSIIPIVDLAQVKISNYCGHHIFQLVDTSISKFKELEVTKRTN